MWTWQWKCSGDGKGKINHSRDMCSIKIMDISFYIHNTYYNNLICISTGWFSPKMANKLRKFVPTTKGLAIFSLRFNETTVIGVTAVI